MARPPRLEIPGVPLHIVQRGVNRSACFFGDVDRRFYLKCLREAARRRGCVVHAYVLMTNHVHLLATPHERGAAGTMLQDVGRKYVRTMNSVHGRTGTLWEGRFKSSPVDSEAYLLNCHRYIELNPVRAGLVADPGEYAWSSYGYYACGRPDDLVTPHDLYESLGHTAGERRKVYGDLVRVPLEDRTIVGIREALNSCRAFGSERFLLDLQEQLGRSAAPPARGRPPSGKPRTPARVSNKLL